MMAQAYVVYIVIALLSIGPLWNFYAVKARDEALEKFDKKFEDEKESKKEKW